MRKLIGWIVIIALLIPTTQVYAAKSNSKNPLTRYKREYNSRKQERKQYIKREYDKYRKQNGDESYMSYDEYEYQREKMDYEARVKFRKEIGFWRYQGGKWFGHWIWYSPTIDKIKDKIIGKTASTIYAQEINKEKHLFFEDIMEMADDDVEAMYDRLKSHVDKSIKSKRDALLTFTMYDYERRNENILQKWWRDVGFSLQEINESGSNTVPTPAPSLPIGL